MKREKVNLKIKIDNQILKTFYFLVVVFSLSFLFFNLREAHAAITIRPMLNTGLVGYWSMDEGYGNKIYDQSGYGNNGTIYSGVFSDDFSTDPSSRWALQNGAFTWSGGQYHTNSAGFNYELYNTSVGRTTQYVKATLVDGYGDVVLRATGNDADGYYAINFDTVNDEVFFNYIDDSGWVELMIPLQSLSLPAAPFTVGVTVTGAGTGTTINIWVSPTSNSPISASAWDAGSDAQDLTMSLSGYAGSNFADTGNYIGLGTDGTAYSFDNFYGGSIGDKWVDGKLGKALDFDGVSGGGGNDNVDLGTANIITGRESAWTICSWVKLDSTSGEANSYEVFSRVTDETDPGGALQLFIGEYGADNNRWGIWTNDGGGTNHYANTEVETGAFQHICAERSGSNVYFYLNGAADGSTAYTQPSSVAGLTQRLGASKYSGTINQVIDGKIDEVRIYNRALSAGEVTRLYNLTKPKILSASDNGLVGYWSFDEGLGTIAGDMSGRGNNGTASGSPTWVNGKKGKALSFNGSNDVQISGLLGQSENITLSAWANLSQADTEGSEVISLGDSVGLRLDHNIRGAMGFFYGGAGPGWVNTNTEAFYAGTGWHHYIYTVDNNNNRQMFYIDGTLATSTVSTDAINYTLGTDTFIGKHGNGESLNDFGGQIDDVRVYNRALSATEVASLYNASKKMMKVNAPQNTKLTDGLVGMWTFNGQDMINGTTARDVTGNGLEAYFLNGPKLTSGRVGQGVAFDADNDVIIASTTSIGEGNAVTVAAWVRFNNPTNNVTKEIVNKYRSGAGMQQWLFIKDRNNATGRLRFAVWNSSDVEAYATSDSAWPTDTSWHHVAGVYDGANVYVYGDGASLDSSPNAQTGAIKSYGNYVCFGGEWNGTTCSDAGNEIDGDLDEVRIYNRALTAAEINRLYRMGK
jgi:hypothetical protein